jgi:beta-lactamase regulating signal transducer with metallopeptidase domain
MNSLISWSNLWGERALEFAGAMFWQSSLVIAAVFILDFLLRRRVRAVVRYTLWLLVLVKLVLPPSLALPTSPAYWVQVRSEPVLVFDETSDLTVTLVERPATAAPVLTPIKPTAPKLRLAGVLLLIWMVGGLGLLAYLAWRARWVRRVLADATDAPAELTALLENCRHELEMRRSVRLRITAQTISPAVCELWRPAILLPDQLAGQLPADQLRAVLLHELAHLKRADVWVNCLQALLQVVYWWHPLLWLANARLRQVREQAVDEYVMLAMKSDANVYPAALLQVARICFQRVAASLGFIGIAESKRALRQRLRRLVEQPLPKSARIGVSAWMAVLLAGTVLLPMGCRTQHTAPVEATASTSIAANQDQLQQVVPGGADGPPQLLIEATFVALSLDDLNKLNLKLQNPRRQPGVHFRDSMLVIDGKVVWDKEDEISHEPVLPKFINAQVKAIGRGAFRFLDGSLRGTTMSERELDEMLKDLKDSKELRSRDVLAAPRITTLSGRHAQVMVVDVHEVVGKTVNVGAVLEVFPHVQEDGISLVLFSSITELRPAEGKVPPTRRFHFMHDRVTVPSGGAVVLHHGGQLLDGHEVLVIVSAKLVDRTGAPLKSQPGAKGVPNDSESDQSDLQARTADAQTRVNALQRNLPKLIATSNST